MLYRIFIGFVVLACGYLVYDSAKMGLALSYAQTAEEDFIFQPENSNPDLTVVVYVDYACTSCRNLHPLLGKAIEDDGQVRLIPRPIASKGIDEPNASAAKLVYAAGKQGKFREAHHDLIHEYRVIDSNFITNFALQNGLDSVKLEEDMNSPEVREQLENNFKNLENIKGQVLPTLLIDGKIIVHVNGPLPSSALIADLFGTARTL